MDVKLLAAMHSLALARGMLFAAREIATSVVPCDTRALAMIEVAEHEIDDARADIREALAASAALGATE